MMERIRKFYIRLLFLCIFMSTISGCAWYTVSLTEGDNCWGMYEKDGVYILQKDMFLLKPSPVLMPTKIALVPEGGRYYMAPNSIEAYIKDPESGSKKQLKGGFVANIKVLDIIESGSKIKVIKMKNRKGWNFYYGKMNDLTPFAEVLSGKYSGVFVDINDLSKKFKEKSCEAYMSKPRIDLVVLDQN